MSFDGCFDGMVAETNEAFGVFAERQLLIYRPKSGLARPIRGIITRPPPDPVVQGVKLSSYSLIIRVDNDPLTGIDHRTFDAGADRIDVPLQMGGKLVERGFSGERAAVDAGMLTLKVV